MHTVQDLYSGFSLLLVHLYMRVGILLTQHIMPISQYQEWAAQTVIKSKCKLISCTVSSNFNFKLSFN